MAEEYGQAVLEVCVDSVAGAAAARAGGAHRIELCAGGSLLEGGTTPSYGLTKLARDAFPVPGKLMVLIRPRGGDFVYTEDDMRVMCDDITACSQLGADGVVFGCLTRDGGVDTTKTGALVSLAKSLGLDVTFHRAFDMVADQSAALQQVKALGIRRVLTSGGSTSALAGAGAIARLVGEAGRTCSIMAGGGVTEDNVAELVSRTGVRELHASATRLVMSSMTFRRPGMTLVSSTPPMDYAWSCAQQEVVAALAAQGAQAVKALPR